MNKPFSKIIIGITLFSFFLTPVFAQERNCTYPPSLICTDGMTIRTVEEWENTRRPELISLYETEVYGKLPDIAVQSRYEEIFKDNQALDGQAIYRKVKITLTYKGISAETIVEIYQPKNTSTPVPVMLGLNFDGNRTEKNETKTPNLLAIENGFAVATFDANDIYPDRADGYEESIFHTLYNNRNIPENERCGALAVWGWGLSRVMDFLEYDPTFDDKKVVLFGHSRMGKAAVWAGARDERFAMVVANNSGCGGAALFRCTTRETINDINNNFPHWFCDNFKKYNNQEELLPVDQNNLLSLIAPRLLYVADASEDPWVDYRSEFRATSMTDEVYNLYDYHALNNEELPDLNDPIVGDRVAYHLRKGTHALTLYDWEQYLNFANIYFNQ